MRPFAFDLFDEFLRGRSIDSLSRETGIPSDRIEMRLRAAAKLSLPSVRELHPPIRPVLLPEPNLTAIPEARDGGSDRPWVSSGLRRK